MNPRGVLKGTDMIITEMKFVCPCGWARELDRREIGTLNSVGILHFKCDAEACSFDNEVHRLLLDTEAATADTAKS